jgi:hypothetical protein
MALLAGFADIAGVGSSIGRTRGRNSDRGLSFSAIFVTGEIPEPVQRHPFDGQFIVEFRTALAFPPLAHNFTSRSTPPALQRKQESDGTRALYH